jgi:hypothetical protein
MQSPYLGQPFLRSYFEVRLRVLRDLVDLGSLKKTDWGGAALAAEFVLHKLTSITSGETGLFGNDALSSSLGFQTPPKEPSRSNYIDTQILIAHLNHLLITSRDLSGEIHFEQDIRKLVKQFELFGSLPCYFGIEAPHRERYQIDTDLYFEFAITLCLAFYSSGNFQSISTLLKLHDSILANGVKMSALRSYLLTASISFEIQTLRSITASKDVDFSSLDLLININEQGA